MLSLLLFFLFIRRTVSQEEDFDPQEVINWYHAPNYRGTWDLIVSCVLTLTICVWSALHLNIPIIESKLRERNIRRVRWILLGIFAPELVVSSAFAQFLTAKWLKAEIQKDIEHRKRTGTGQPHGTAWTLRQCYFAVMGGVVVETGPCVAGSPKVTLTAEGIRLLSFLDRLPPGVHENEIRDKSKADGLAKFLVVLQAGWMILQTIARVEQRLPVTLLEINTIGHVICAFALYLLWWYKPLDVKDPIVLVREEWRDPIISLMWMCSPISGNKDDEISEMRCMAYTPPSERRNKTPAITVTNEENNKAHNEKKNGEKDKPGKNNDGNGIPIKPHSTHLSIGSIGARNPQKFIGPVGEIQVGTEDETFSSTPFDNQLRYVIKGKTLKTAPEHEIFFTLQNGHPEYGLCHTRKYCRRAFGDCEDHGELPVFAVQRWHNTNTIIDDLWNECEKRRAYKDFFFTVSSLGIFVGEPVYIDTHIPNFLGLSYLGSVNVHRDRLKSILAFAGSAYGGLHLAAWNDYFPSQAERWTWIACALTTGATGFFFALFFFLGNKIHALERVEYRISNSRAVKWLGMYVLAPLFFLARGFIVAEAFICLRRQPAAVYQTPEWINYVPHL